MSDVATDAGASAMPPALRAQIERANALIGQQNGEGEPQEQPETPERPPAPETPEPAPPPPAPASDAPPPAQAADEFKTKYDVLKGKYDAEVPRLSQQLREAQDRMGQLELLLAASAPVPPGNGAQPVVTDGHKAAAGHDGTAQIEISPAEREDYGDELLDVIARQAQLAVGRQLTDITQRVARLEGVSGQIVQQTQRSAQERVFDALDASVPGWREQNTDAGFNEWLDELDPFAGRTRKHLLTQAFGANDATRVVAFFSAYRKENAVTTGQAQPPSQRMVPRQPPARANATLETLAAPGRGRGAAGAPDGGDKRMWTPDMVRKFYADKTAGRYRGREAEAMRLEADMIAAQSEGRFVR